MIKIMRAALITGMWVRTYGMREVEDDTPGCDV
jgi:hypothetical protein